MSSTYLEATQESGRALFSRNIQGPVVMLNLLRFRDVADGHGDTAAIQSLLEAGANIDARDEGAMTALLWASTDGRTAAALALIKAGADVREACQ